RTNSHERRKLTMTVKIVAYSTMPLNLANHKRVKSRKTKSGIKLHLSLVFMEQGLSYPDQAVITNAAEHDRGQLEGLIDDKACMYVFGRGDLGYERFDRVTDDVYNVVSCLRTHAVERVLDTFSVLEDSEVLSAELSVIGTSQ